MIEHLFSLAQDLDRKLSEKYLRERLNTSRDPIEQRWIREKIALEELRASSIIHKKEEIVARERLVNSLGGYDEDGNFHALEVSPQTLQKMQDAIQTAKSKTISKSMYDRKQTIERAIEHGKVGPIPARRQGRVGGGLPGEKIHQYDLNSATFAGLVDKLGEKINSSANTARQAVTQVALHKSKGHNDLKPYVDELSRAIRKKDSAAKLVAIKNLKQQMKEWAERAPAIQSLARNIKWLPFFQRMKTDLEMIANQKLVLINEGQNLNENQISFIQHLIRNGRKITDAYRRHYHTSDSKLQISFDNTVEYLDMVLDQLSARTGVNV